MHAGFCLTFSREDEDYVRENARAREPANNRLERNKGAGDARARVSHETSSCLLRLQARRRTEEGVLSHDVSLSAISP